MNENRSSKRQRELLTFVDGFIKGNGYGPSYREIMRALGYKSVSTVAIHIDGLIQKGYLLKRDNSARSLEVVSVRLDAPVPKKDVTDAQEKWFISTVTKRLTELEKDPTHISQTLLGELQILITTLKILGLDEAYETMTTRLATVTSGILKET